MPDVLLINPPMWSPEAQDGFSAICPPLGLGYLAAALAAEGIAVKILDLNFSTNLHQDLKEALSENSIRLVGITGLTQNMFLALKVARQVKKIKKDAVVAIGGPHVSYQWAETLEHPEIDIVVRFEGEAALVQLYKALHHRTPDLKAIDGIAFRQNGRCLSTEPGPKQEDLDLMPFPARHLLPMANYSRPGTVMTSRGCPIKCIFCISSKYEGRYRTRSPENVVAEIEMMHRSWGIRDYYFIDNVFTVDKDRVDGICERIIRKKLDISFSCVSRADLVTRDIVERLKAAGCIRIEIGVESGVQKNIDAFEKKITLEHVHQAAEIVVGAGLRPMFTFQIGSPYDTPETIMETQNLAADLRAKGGMTFFSIMTPYPGTILAEKAQKYGIDIQTRDWRQYRTSNPVFNTPYANRNDFRKALYLETLRQSDPALTSATWSV